MRSTALHSVTKISVLASNYILFVFTLFWGLHNCLNKVYSIIKKVGAANNFVWGAGGGGGGSRPPSKVCAVIYEQPLTNFSVKGALP